MAKPTRYRGSIARVAVFGLTVALVGCSQAPAGPEVTAVTGSAYGFWAELSLFGGPSSERGPEPMVELGEDASDSPQDATVEDVAAVFGPATIFRAKRIAVTAEARLGTGGSATTSARVEADTDAEHGHAQLRPGPLYYDVMESTCDVDANGDITATTTIEGGLVVTSYDPVSQLPETEEAIPESPEPGHTVEGTIDHVSDRFRVVFNEQVENADGSLTVNAAHIYLLGDIAVGDVIIAQSTCGASTSDAG